MEVELTVVVFTYWQDETQDEFDLWTKVAQEEHRKAPDVPKVEIYFP